MKLAVEVLALVVVLADVLLGVGLLWFRSRLDGGRDFYNTTRGQVAADEALTRRLEKTQASLPEAQQQLKQFLQDHVPSRRDGAARATHLIFSLKQDSDVQLEGIGFKPLRLENQPLQRLPLEVSVEGSFPNLITFAHDLETSDEFIIARGFNFGPGENGKLSLHLSADFYITP